MKYLMTGICQMIALVVLASAAEAIEIIRLQHRDGAEMVEVLTPLLAPGGTLKAYREKLILDTTPANAKEIKAVLSQLDRKPQMLKIYVRNNSNADSASTGVGITGGRIELPNKGNNSVAIRANDDASRSQGNSIKEVSGIEGERTFIATQTQYHFPSLAVTNTDGFYVTPHISGETVTLDLDQSSDEPVQQASQAGANIRAAVISKSQSIHTHITGRTGEWIEIGGVASQSDNKSAGILSRDQMKTKSKGSVSIMIQPLSQK